jgi:hypothetical protein
MAEVLEFKSVGRLGFLAGLAAISLISVALLISAGVSVVRGTFSGASVPKHAGTGPRPPGALGHAAVARRAKAGVGRCGSSVPGQALALGHRIYAREGLDTFTNTAPLGSFAQRTANAIVYTGDHGMQWTGYPDGWSSTYSGRAEGYQPSTVLSVHDGMLDFYLHNDARGNPVGADPSPLPNGNRYQTYGAWSMCERVAPADGHNLADFHQAILLWPFKFSDWLHAESDYPEQNLNKFDFAGYSHYGSGAQAVFDIRAVVPHFDTRQWHVYTQTWGPGFRSYYVDGRLVGRTTRQRWSQPERWQLQIEPMGSTGPVPNDRDSGHVYMKWVWIGTEWSSGTGPLG